MPVVAITAGAQGIGRAIAFTFARKGYAVSIMDTAVDAGEEAAGMIVHEGGRSLFVEADVADEAAIRNWIGRTVSDLGPPSVLINNAGRMIRKPFLDLTSAEFDRALGVGLRAAFVASQAAARAMIAADISGSIINIASTRAKMSEPNTEAYAASKGGIVALTHAMAVSLGPRIRVNAISPGWIETRDWQFSGRAKTPHHSEADRSQHPVGRVGTPDDIARACLYLAGDAAFTTGQNLVIDGGMTVKMIYEE